MMRKKFILTHWLPVAVVLFGVLGAVLFAWTNHINEKQRVNYLLLDAITPSTSTQQGQAALDAMLEFLQQPGKKAAAREPVAAAP